MGRPGRSSLPDPGGSRRRERREVLVAWVANGLACLYCGWMGVYLWRSTGVFGKMFEGLGAELPGSTSFVVVQRAWLYPTVFGALVVALLVKEALVSDKRLSTMLSLVVTILAQFLAQWMMTLYYLPLFDLIGKLS
jgi:hypothetical protein